MVETNIKKDELGMRLHKIVKFMKEAGTSFDGGFMGESRRLANCVITLLMDRPDRPSLLTQMNMKDILFFDDCPDYNPKLDLPFCGLAVPTIGGAKMRYIARLGKNLRVPKRVSLEQWWTKPVIVDNKSAISLTREDIILFCANSNVGAVDSSHTGLYEEAELSPANVSPKKDISQGMTDILFPSMRQISFEVKTTLFEHCPHYFEVH